MKLFYRLKITINHLLVLVFIFSTQTRLSAQVFNAAQNKYAFDNRVETIVTDNSGNTYIGGNFNYVGLWYGHWVALDATAGTVNPDFAKVAGGLINAVIAIPGGQGWYIGGSFTHVNGETRNNLARINADGSLHPFNQDINGTVYALILDANGNLYAGGDFTSVGGGTTRNRLCKFDNAGVLQSFDPNMNSRVLALALDASGNLYAGGDFTSVGGGTTRNRLCKFDNTGVLQSFDPNINSRVAALATDASGNLYAGGTFSTVNGLTRNRLCKFDNAGVLQSFDPNMNSSVSALTTDASGNLYAGGSFTTVGGTNRNRLCKFDNAGVLQSFDPNMNSVVRALTIDASGNLYAGGSFTTVNSSPRNQLCKFDNTSSLTSFNGPKMQYYDDFNGGLLNAGINSLAVDANGTLYVGSNVTLVDAVPRGNLCKLDNTGTLTSFNPNMNSTVQKLAIDGGGNLYAAGYFTSVGGTSRNRLCKFDQSGNLLSFNPPSINSAVLDLVIDINDNIYAGGFFTNVGGTTRNRLCKFDNAGVLQSFDPNMNGFVRALALEASGNLYAGGDFTSVAGGTTRNRLCKFDNTGVLQSFDPNMNSAVRALTIDASGNLYAGGDFTSVGGGTTRNRLCKFDNAGNLHAFNPDMNNGIVNALTTDASGNLYAGGTFSTVNGLTRNRLCKFDNSGVLQSFTPNFNVLGSVLTLAFNGNNESIYAGGSYSAPSYNFSVFSPEVVSLSIQWQGATSTDWNTTSNWNPTNVPQATDDVTIPNVVNLPIISNTAQVNNLTIDASASVTISHSNTLHVNGDFTNNGQIILKSDVSGNYAQLKFDGTYSGSGTVAQEQYLTEGWHYMGASVAGNAGMLGEVGTNRHPNAKNLRYWDATSGDWLNVTDNNTSLVAGRGYNAFVGTNGVITSAAVVTLTGVPHTSVTPLIAYNAQSPVWTNFAGGLEDGWNLVANPFCASLDFNSISGSLSNIENAFHIWDPNADAFVSWSPAAPGLGEFIAPLQSFWVRAQNASSPSLGTLTYANTTVSATPTYRKTQSISDHILLSATEAANPSHKDVLTIALTLEQQVTNGFDNHWDARKMMNPGTTPTLYALGGGTATAINTINFTPFIQQKHIMPLGFSVETPQATTYEIALDDRFLNNSYQIYLEDSHANKFHDLNSGPYRFSYAADAPQRFNLHLSNTTLDLTQPTPPILAWVKGNNIELMSTDYRGPISCTLVSTSGKTVFNSGLQQITIGETLALIIPELPTAVYILQLVTDHGVKIEKIQYAR